jgi:nicotinamide mononucleotide transporter
MIEFIINNWVEIIGAILGLLYLYFEYKADILMWPIGLAMSAFYTVVFIKATFYAFACINIYYIITGIYGWIQWHKNKDNTSNDGSIALRHFPSRLYIPLIIASVILWGVIAWLLKEFTDSHVVYGDSFVTALSIVALVMLFYRYVEQWLLLIVVNVVSVALYYSQEMYPTAIMYLFYAVCSIFGYIKWRKLAGAKSLKKHQFIKSCNHNENISSSF